MNPPEAQLRKILELERRKGYADTAVVGGLDRYLKNLIQRDNLGPRSPVTESIMVLPTHGYASLPREERQRWLARTLQLLGGAVERPAAASTVQRARTATARPKRQPARPAVVAPEPTSAFERPVTALKGVSTALAAKLARLDVATVQDMLFFFPRRYNDFASIRPIADLIVGEEQTVIGAVWSAQDTPIGRRLRGTEALVGDETGMMRVVWFNQPYIAQQLRTNERIVLAGRVTLYKGQKTLENPEYEPLESEELLHTGRLVPVYHTTSGLAGRTVRRLAKQALDAYAGALPELLPPDLLSRNRMLPRTTALRQMHFPDGWDDLKAARRRLAFDELLLIQVGVLERKREWQERGLAQPLRLPEEMRRGYVESLPFALTGAQQRAMAQTLADVARERPMSRLLQGDVGSGKTVVAAAALLAATASGAQGAMMAPTEILAEQHFHTLCRVFGCSERTISVATVRPDYLSKPLTIALLTGSVPAPVKRELREQIAAGDIDIVVGTHAVIQEGVSFHRLGLAVVDEQHRFGVMQRAALREKGRNPHVLVMTATPIPRTLTLTVYGDLDVSVIDEMPPGRKPVETRWVPPDERDAAYEFVRAQVQQGYQAFVICPLIEESETLATRAATQEFERLSSEIFPEARLGLLHGRLGAQKKESVMRDFRDRRLDILVSTAVVEVGVDIPNATVMMVEGAERFGLAQLHQLRGRVGRSDIQSYCLLLSDSPAPDARERLQIVERTQDGFALAEQDLRLRGPGEFFGTRQSGLPDLKVAQLSDVPLIELARTEASRLLDSDADLARPEHAQLKEEVSRLWERVTAEAH
ncbi:MAG: ATP-dependent DNA helicase RecG [Dehalococcoidia bacterium]|nr:ATP-dependent DNA helicase RecG [Dehalococcoidia bacterium]